MQLSNENKDLLLLDQKLEHYFGFHKMSKFTMKLSNLKTIKIFCICKMFIIRITAKLLKLLINIFFFFFKFSMRKVTSIKKKKK
jgi:hypothetical protein